MNKSNFDLIILTTFLLIVSYLLFHSVLYSPFFIDDDYNLIHIKKPNELFGKNDNWFQDFIDFQKRFIYGGRFFPLLASLVFFRGKLAGTNPFAQHIIVLLFGVGSALFIYLIGKKLNFSIIVSFICAIIFLTGFEFGEIFMRLQSGESPGLFFILVCVYFILKFQASNNNKDLYLSVLFGLFASLCKESFIIILPLIPLIILLGNSPHELLGKIKENELSFYLFLAVFAVLTFLLLMIVKFSSKIDFYGENLSLPPLLLNNFIWIFKWFVPFMPFLAFVIYDLYRRKELSKISLLTLFSTTLICSQLIIYYKLIITASLGRYLLPSGLIFIFLLGLSLKYIENNYKKLFLISLFLIGLITLRNAKIIHINSNEFAARANAYKSLIDEMVKVKSKKIAIYGDYEFYQSISTFFLWNNYKPQLITTPIVRDAIQNIEKYDNSESKSSLKEKFIASYNYRPVYDLKSSSLESSLQERLKSSYKYQTLDDLKSDSTVNYLISSFFKEGESLNFTEISKTFPHHKKICATFTNATFRDLLKWEFWKGNLKNDQRTLIVFYK